MTPRLWPRRSVWDAWLKLQPKLVWYKKERPLLVNLQQLIAKDVQHALVRNRLTTVCSSKRETLQLPSVVPIRCSHRRASQR